MTIILYHDITPETLDAHLSARKSGTLRDLPTGSLVITIDDGHSGNYDLKPVLEKHGAPVTVFICSGIAGTNRGFWFKHNAVSGNVAALKSATIRRGSKVGGRNRSDHSPRLTG